MQALLIKLTSMGDLVQALPALTDAQQAIPDIQFDWVVDESFAEIPRWHPAVSATIETAHRRWRQALRHTWRGGEFSAFVKTLRAKNYSAVIDAQSNLKSACATLLARGTRHGPNSQSVREYGAQFAYHRRYAIDKNQLAIERTRQLFAQVFDYPPPATAPDFGLANTPWPAPEIELPARPYLVFVHNASWNSKSWQTGHWRQLLHMAGAAGFNVLLPWGSQQEHEQAQRIAANCAHAQVLPRLSLTQIASIFLQSCGAICVDTGLAHIAACLDIPTLTLYGPTDPALIGATGDRSKFLVAEGFACIPCYKKLCTVGDYRGPEAQCLKALTTEKVWALFTAIAAR